MSSRSEEWENYFVWGARPADVTTKELPMPDGVYVCSGCGVINSYFQWMCANCSDVNGGDLDGQ